MKPALTLHEYRLLHPRTAPIPTITQRGLIGQILERQRRRAIRTARRRAALRRLMTLPAAAIGWLKRALSPAERVARESFAGATSNHA